MKLVEEIESIARNFLNYLRFELWDSDQVEIYRHIDVIFPGRDHSIVIVVPKSEYGQHVLKRAMASMALLA